MGGLFRRQPSTTAGSPARSAASVAATVFCIASAACQATDVYISTGPDGSARYATQALDASYSLFLRDSPPALGRAKPPAQPPGDARRLRPLIAQLAQRHDVPQALVEAVVAVESSFNARAVSSKGARGAMQLMPATGRRYGLVEQRQFDSPHDNIDAGVRHLKELLARHDGNVALALAAYNAGSGAVSRHGNRIPPYPETMLYVPAVLGRAAAGQP